MSKYYNDVLEFRKKHNLTISEEPRLLTIPEFMFWNKFILEEQRELCTAHDNSSLVDAADAVVDLIYVVIDIAIVMGLPLDAIWDAVHKANMNGKIKVTDASESKRNHLDDVKKGPEFVSPENEITKILGVDYEK